MSKIPKMVYGFKAILIKTPKIFFTELEKKSLTLMKPQ